MRFPHHRHQDLASRSTRWAVRELMPDDNLERLAPALDTVQLDRSTAGEFLYSGAHLCKYRLQLDEI